MSIEMTNGFTTYTEENDLSKISVGQEGGGYVLPSEGLKRQIATLEKTSTWDEREYGISRAAQLAELRESLAKTLLFESTPAGIEFAKTEAEKTLAAMRQRALERFGIQPDHNGKVPLFVAGKPAWHNLGKNVQAAQDSESAARLGELLWQVEKTQNQYLDHTGTVRKSEGSFTLYRADTGAHLGNVGPLTKVIQNSEGFKFLDSVMGRFGARYVSAGALYGGKKVFMQIEIPGAAFSIRGDHNQAYAIFTNCHDGSGSAFCFPLSFRVECANTFRRAVNSRTGFISIPHTGNLDKKIEAAQQALGLSVEGLTDYASKAQILVQTPVGDFVEYTDSVLDAVLDITKADLAHDGPAWMKVANAPVTDRDELMKAFEREVKNRETILADIKARYESETCGVGGIRGSAWSAFNAISEAADHGPLGGRFKGKDSEDGRSRRFESIIGGKGDAIKQTAFTAALALA
jgi:phage/plasmid-like protein (TIGR03299 family)